MFNLSHLARTAAAPAEQAKAADLRAALSSSAPVESSGADDDHVMATAPADVDEEALVAQTAELSVDPLEAYAGGRQHRYQLPEAADRAPPASVLADLRPVNAPNGRRRRGQETPNASMAVVDAEGNARLLETGARGMALLPSEEDLAAGAAQTAQAMDMRLDDELVAETDETLFTPTARFNAQYVAQLPSDYPPPTGIFAITIPSPVTCSVDGTPSVLDVLTSHGDDVELSGRAQRQAALLLAAAARFGADNPCFESPAATKAALNALRRAQREEHANLVAEMREEHAGERFRAPPAPPPEPEVPHLSPTFTARSGGGQVTVPYTAGFIERLMTPNGDAGGFRLFVMTWSPPAREDDADDRLLRLEHVMGKIVEQSQNTPEVEPNMLTRHLRCTCYRDIRSVDDYIVCMRAYLGGRGSVPPGTPLAQMNATQRLMTHLRRMGGERLHIGEVFSHDSEVGPCAAFHPEVALEYDRGGTHDMQCDYNQYFNPDGSFRGFPFPALVTHVTSEGMHPQSLARRPLSLTPLMASFLTSVQAARASGSLSIQRTTPNLMRMLRARIPRGAGARAPLSSSNKDTRSAEEEMLRQDVIRALGKANEAERLVIERMGVGSPLYQTAMARFKMRRAQELWRVLSNYGDYTRVLAPAMVKAMESVLGAETSNEEGVWDNVPMIAENLDLESNALLWMITNATKHFRVIAGPRQRYLMLSYFSALTSAHLWTNGIKCNIATANSAETGKSYVYRCVINMLLPGVAWMPAYMSRLVLTGGRWDARPVFMEEAPVFLLFGIGPAANKSMDGGGTELIKTMMTNQFLEVYHLRLNDRGERELVRSVVSAVTSFQAATNVSMTANSVQKTAEYTRWIWSAPFYDMHDGSNIKLRDVVFPTSDEINSPAAAAFRESMARTHAIILIVNAFIAAAVFHNVIADVAVHAMAYLNERLEADKLPRMQPRFMEQAMQMIIATCIFCKQRMFFGSEFSTLHRYEDVDGRRCCKRLGPEILLEFEKHLVVNATHVMISLTGLEPQIVPIAHVKIREQLRRMRARGQDAFEYAADGKTRDRDHAYIEFHMPMERLAGDIAAGMGGENIVSAMQVQEALSEIKDMMVTTRRAAAFALASPTGVYEPREVNALKFVDPAGSVGRKGGRRTMLWVSVDFLDAVDDRVRSGYVGRVLTDFFSHYNSNECTVLTHAPVRRDDYPELTDDERSALRPQYSDMFGVAEIRRTEDQRVLRRYTYSNDFVDAITSRAPNAAWTARVVQTPGLETAPLSNDIVTRYTMVHHERIGYADEHGLRFDPRCDPHFAHAIVRSIRADNAGVFPPCDQDYPLDQLRALAKAAVATTVAEQLVAQGTNPLEDPLVFALDPRAEQDADTLLEALRKLDNEGVDYSAEIRRLEEAKARRLRLLMEPDGEVPVVPRAPSRAELVAGRRRLRPVATTGKFRVAAFELAGSSMSDIVHEMSGTMAVDTPEPAASRRRTSAALAERIAAPGSQRYQAAVNALRSRNVVVIADEPAPAAAPAPMEVAAPTEEEYEVLMDMA